MTDTTNSNNSRDSTFYENYIITFDSTDLEGESFSKSDTQFWLEYIKPKMIMYNHMLDKHPLGISIKNNRLTYEEVPQEFFIIGEIQKLDIDDSGIKAVYRLYEELPKFITDKFQYWDNYVEDEHKYWLKLVKEKHDSGKLAFSTDSIKRLTRREENHENTLIKSWPIPFVSLTHIPAEPQNNPNLKTLIEEYHNEDDIKSEKITPNKPINANEKGLKMDNEETVVDGTKEAEILDEEKMVDEEMKMDSDLDERLTKLEIAISSMLELMSSGEEMKVDSEPRGESETTDNAYNMKADEMEKEAKNMSGAGKYAVSDTQREAMKSINMNVLGKDNSDDPYRFTKAIRLLRDKPHNAQKELKALGLVPASSGGYTTQIEQSNELIDLLLERSVFFSGGEAERLVNIMPMASDTMTVPVLSSGINTYWIGENSAITESEPQFEQRSLVAKKMAVLVPISNELLADNSVQLENKLRELIVRQMRNAADRAILNGSGIAGQPLGIRGRDGVTHTALNAAPTYDNLVDTIQRLENANVELDDSVFWLFNPREKATLRKIQDGASQYIFTDTGIAQSLTSPVPSSLLGYKWISSNNVELGQGSNSATEGDIFLARWRDVIVGLRSDIELRVSDVAGNSFANDQTLIRAIMRMDVALAHPESVQVLTDVRTS